MVFPFFVDENAAQGLPPGTQSPIQAGVTDADDGALLEQNLTLPWASDPTISWVEYNCWIEVHLDPGTVLHKPLPQTNDPVDTLASIDAFADDADSSIDSVNWRSKGTYSDVIQKMATSTYYFVLKGWAVRSGYKIPIPGLKSIAGIPAVPTHPQRVVGPIIVGNFSGIPLYFAQWELWYLIGDPPSEDQESPPNPGAHISGDVELPDSIQVPFSQTDANAEPGGGVQGGGPQNPFPGGPGLPVI